MQEGLIVLLIVLVFISHRGYEFLSSFIIEKLSIIGVSLFFTLLIGNKIIKGITNV